MHGLHIAEPAAKSHMAIYTFAHAQRQCPILSTIADHGYVRRMSRLVVSGREPRDDRLVVLEKAHSVSRAWWNVVHPYCPL